MCIINDKTIEKLRKHILTVLSTERYNHSVSVANTAKKLAIRYEEDQNLAYFAGLCHDMCKEMDKTLMEKFVIQNGYTLTYSETQKPSLLHGKAAAVTLAKTFSINTESILEAVQFHTFGKKSMGPIAKIVCIADKIEPLRPYMNEDKFNNYLKKDLHELLVSVLTEIIEIRRDKKEEVFPEALWVLSKN